MWKILLTVTLLAGIPLAARGSVPPPNWAPPVYNGPGVFCGDGFNLRLEAGETATVSFPSEGYEPVYVRAHDGFFGVVVYGYNRPDIEKSLLTKTKYGDVYIVDRIVKAASSGVPIRRSYWFEPADKSAPFSLIFYDAVPGKGGWDTFPPSKYLAMVKRLSFAAESPTKACLGAAPAK